METRSRKKKAMEVENNDANYEHLMKRQHKEDRLRSLLGPFDKYICGLECVLVWDYPIVFILLLVFINLLFWLYTITPFYCLLSFCSLVVLCTQFVSNHLWPLINDSDDSMDGWVKLSASNEERFDLVRSTAHLLTTLDAAYTSCEQVKRNNPQKFNILGFIFFFFILIISFFVNDFYLVYFSVMALFCWPGCQHNRLPDRLLNLIRPHLTSLEKALHIRRTVNKRKLRERAGRKKGRTHKEEDEQLRLDKLVMSDDDSDADLQQFLPGHHDDLHDDLFPIFSTLKNPGVDDDDDDDETAREYLPHVTTLSDSRENTDDEFMPDVDNFALQDMSLASPSDIKQRASHAGEVRENRKLSPKRGQNKTNKEEDGAKRKGDDGGGKVGGKDGEGEVVSEEMFAEGLSFDDEDEADAVETPNEATPSIEPTSLLGGLLGQPKSASIEVDSAQKTSGLLFRAIGGFNFLKKAVTSVYAPSGGDGGSKVEKDVMVVDNEFDFLQQEDLDDVEEF